MVLVIYCSYFLRLYRRPRDSQMGMKIPITPLCPHANASHKKVGKRQSYLSSKGKKPGSTTFFLCVAPPTSDRWRHRDLGQLGRSGEKGLRRVLTTASDGQKFRFSLRKCLAGPSSPMELGLTASREEASPDAPIVWLMDHTKKTPSQSQKMLHYVP